MRLVDTVIAAAVAALTSVVVTALSLVLTSRQRKQGEERAHRREIEGKFLNPLRLRVALVHIRLVDVLARVEGGGTRKQALDVVADAAQVRDQEPAWFTGEGCYLASTAYLTACLFAWMDRISKNHPFLELQQRADTELTGLMANVQRAFLQDFGIYSVLQATIGHQMWDQHEDRLITYREFCALLCNFDDFVWFERIFVYYRETGRGEKLDRVRHAVLATEDLARFLDRCVPGKGAIIDQLVGSVVLAYP